MKARSYFGSVQALLQKAAYVLSFEIAYEEIDLYECYIRGRLQLENGLQLHIAEYVVTEPQFKRMKYRYHLQNEKGQRIVRWDNAPHHQVDTFPHHRHDADGRVYASPAMDIEQVLQSIVTYLD